MVEEVLSKNDNPISFFVNFHAENLVFLPVDNSTEKILKI